MIAPNDEQQIIIDASMGIIENKSTAIIRARPGTGKTQTLRSIAESNPKKKFLYISFSKANVVSASKSLPSNCKSYHVHSLALRYSKLKGHEIVSSYSTNNISKTLGITMKIAAEVRTVFEGYCENYQPILSLYLRKYEKKKKISHKSKKALISLVTMMGKRTIPIPHAYYLKEFSYRLQTGQIKFNFDCALIDEYQDTSGVIACVYANFPCARIYVGDADQAIFGFMGATDSSIGVDFDYEFYLSKNYRSKNTIIDIANDVLENIMGREYKIEKGIKDTDIIPAKKDAVICRTNSAIIEYISAYQNFLLVKNPEDIFEEPIIFRKWLNGETEYTRDRKYWFLKNISGKKELTSFLKERGESGMLSSLSIASKYDKQKLEALLQKAKRNNSLSSHRIILTGHAAKGLEFDNVRIGYDFPNLFELAKAARIGAKSISELGEETRLYYVAITRAKSTIVDASPNAKLSDSQKFFIKGTFTNF